MVHDLHDRSELPCIPDPVVFIPVAVSTSGRINEETLSSRLLFLHVNREADTLDGELPEESNKLLFDILTLKNQCGPI